MPVRKIYKVIETLQTYEVATTKDPKRRTCRYDCQQETILNLIDKVEVVS